MTRRARCLAVGTCRSRSAASSAARGRAGGAGHRASPRPSERSSRSSGPGRTSGRSSTPGCATSSAAELEERLAPLVELLPDEEDLWLGKRPLANVHGCEGLYLASEAEDVRLDARRRRWARSPTRPSSCRSTGGARPVPGELVDEAIARLIDGSNNLAEFLGGLREAERAELRSGAVERTTMFLECFPPLEARWRPVTESRLRVDLCDGRVVLSGKVDLTVGRAEGLRAGKVLLDLKTGGFSPSHRDDLRFYALMEALRIGVPPRLVASYYLDGARPPRRARHRGVLRSALERVVQGAEAIVELLYLGRAPGAEARRPLPLVPACGPPARPGIRWLEHRDDEDGVPGARRLVASEGPAVTSAPMAPPKPTKPAHPGTPGEGTGATAPPRSRWCPCPKADDDAGCSPTPAGPTSTSGAAPSACGRWPAGPTARSTTRWHRVEWEGLEHIPTTGGALLVSNHAGAIPSDAPAIMHGIETELGGPSTAWPTRSSSSCRSSAPCGRGSGACSPTPTTPTGSCASSTSSPSCSPRARRARARPTASATSCAGSAAAASSRSRCAPACRSCRSPWSAPRRPCRSSGRARSWRSCSASPTCRSPRTCSPSPGSGPSARRCRCRPRSRSRCSRPCTSTSSPTSRATPAAGSWTSPSASGSSIQEALYEMLRARRSVWFG